MRELKFRVWHKGENRWLDPYLEEDPMINLFGEVYMYERPPISGWTNKEYVNKNLVVQQYTGLKDKNGKEIYEGDIIKEIHWEDWGDLDGFEYIGVVHRKCYSYKGFQFSGFVTFPSIESHENYSGNRIHTDCEVIGNIFENPELL